MLLAYFCTIILFQAVNAQPRLELDAKGLDSLLQDYSFRALVRPKTGIIYNGNVPSNLTGIHAAALRLRSGSLRRKGVVFNEFHLPVGVVEQPYVERLVLVYHNLGNWSELYYPLPGHTFLAPVLGLLAYDASDLTAVNPPELNIRASGEPISVTFPSTRAGPGGKCVHFGLDGSLVFDEVVNGSTCLTTNAGHYSIVVETAVAPSPEPVTAPSPGGGVPRSSGGKGKGKGKRRVWIVVGSVVGGAALVVLLVVLFAYVRRCRRRKKIRRMERAAEVGVPLPMTAVGNTKAPVALETRTKPFLENEFVP